MFSKSKLDKKPNGKLVKTPNNKRAKDLGSKLKSTKELNDNSANRSSNNDKLSKKQDKAKSKYTKLNKLWRTIVWISRRLAILIFIFMVFNYASSVYLDNEAANEAEVFRVQAYKEALKLMKPNTPMIDRRKELLLEQILVAESDGKIVLSEYIAIDREYRRLEDDMIRVLEKLEDDMIRTLAELRSAEQTELRSAEQSSNKE